MATEAKKEVAKLGTFEKWSPSPDSAAAVSYVTKCTSTRKHQNTYSWAPEGMVRAGGGHLYRNWAILCSKRLSHRRLVIPFVKYSSSWNVSIVVWKKIRKIQSTYRPAVLPAARAQTPVSFQQVFSAVFPGKSRREIPESWYRELDHLRQLRL